MKSRYLILAALILSSCGNDKEDNVPPADNKPEDNRPVDNNTDDNDSNTEEVIEQIQCTSLTTGDMTIGERTYAMDGWNWENKRQILPLLGGANWSEPSLLLVGDKLHLYVSTQKGITYKLYHSVASLSDLYTWSEPEAVKGVETARHPSLLYADGKFKMWYGAGLIGYAESTDGIDFTVKQAWVLDTGNGSTFDSVSLSTPSVIKEDGVYKMWYTGFDGNSYGIGLATSTDGKSFTRTQKTPVMSVGSANDFDNTAAAQPWVVAQDGQYNMWYAGYDTSLTNPGPYRVGIATSTDGINWEKHGVSVDLSATGDDAFTTWEPSTVRLPDGRWFMVYVGMSDKDYKYRLLAVDSTSCGFTNK